MNNCTFMGRLTKDPEIKYFDSGKMKASFTIAVNNGKDKDATFIDCDSWDKQAETISTHFQKGDMIGVVARADKQTWEDKEDPEKKRSKIVFVVKEFTFGQSKNKEQD